REAEALEQELERNHAGSRHFRLDAAHDAAEAFTVGGEARELAEELVVELVEVVAHLGEAAREHVDVVVAIKLELAECLPHRRTSSPRRRRERLHRLELIVRGPRASRTEDGRKGRVARLAGDEAASVTVRSRAQVRKLVLFTERLDRVHQAA